MICYDFKKKICWLNDGWDIIPPNILDINPLGFIYSNTNSEQMHIIPAEYFGYYPLGFIYPNINNE